MARLTQVDDEAAVVGRREVDDGAVARDRSLVVRLTGRNRPDIDGAPVAAIRNRAAHEPAQRSDCIESLMRKDRPVDGVPAPARSCRRRAAPRDPRPPFVVPRSPRRRTFPPSPSGHRHTTATSFAPSVFMRNRVTKLNRPAYASVASGSELVAGDGLRQLQKPRLEDRGSRASPRRRRRPTPAACRAPACRLRSPDAHAAQQRQQRLRLERHRIALDPGEIVGREHRPSTQQLRNPRGSEWLRPVHSQRVGVAARGGTVVGRDDEMFRRIVKVRKLVERYPAGPFGLAAPAVDGKRAVAACARSGCGPGRNSRCGRRRRRTRSSATGPRSRGAPR